MSSIRFQVRCAALGAVALILPSVTARAAEAPFSLQTEIPIPGEGGWDYLAVDSPAHRLYVSHATEVAVIDLLTNKVVGKITETPGVHGIAVAPELGRGFVTNGKEAKVSVFDLKTLKTLSKVSTGENPDAVLYEPKHKEVYAFNGRSSSATVINAKTGEVVTTISLPGKPEFAVEDEKAGRIYNNLEDKNAVAVIDIDSHKVVTTWPIAPGEAASGMAFDREHHRLFLGCENKLLVVMNSQTGKVVTTAPIGAGVDANAFDAGLKLVFASNGGDGTVTVARVSSPDKVEVIQTLPTEPRSKTMTLDPATHRLYVAAAKFGPVPAASPTNARPRAPLIPGTMRVLVYGTAAH